MRKRKSSERKGHQTLADEECEHWLIDHGRLNDRMNLFRGEELVDGCSKILVRFL
jgi:hypothetical protein